MSLENWGRNWDIIIKAIGIFAYLEGPQVEGVLGEHPPALSRAPLLHLQGTERAALRLDRGVFPAARQARPVAVQEGVETVVVAPAAAIHKHLAPGQDGCA